MNIENPFAPKRLEKVTKMLNVGKDSIIEYLESQHIEIENNPNAKLTQRQFNMVAKEFADSKS